MGNKRDQEGGETSGGIRWKGVRVGGERREVDVAKVEVLIRVIHRISGAVRAGRDLRLKPRVESGLIDEGGRCQGKGIGESPEGRGGPSEVDLA